MSGSSRPWTRRWQFWLVCVVLAIFGINSIGNATTPKPKDDAGVSAAGKPSPARTTESSAPREEPTPETAALLFVVDQKDGDSWVGSDGSEYRLGLVNTPERNEPCAAEATAFTRTFLEDGFTVDAYSTDTHGRTVAEVFDESGRSLNIALAKSGLGDDRYLEQFRHENPDLGRRLDRALASAAKPGCGKAAAPVPLVDKPKPKPKAKPAKACMEGYSPCLPIVADLNCPDIGHPVKVTGPDPYGLDRDHDGIGCD